jgi:hypothetical protein
MARSTRINELAFYHKRFGRYAEAEALYRRALARAHPVDVLGPLGCVQEIETPGTLIDERGFLLGRIAEGRIYKAAERPRIIIRAADPKAAEVARNANLAVLLATGRSRYFNVGSATP